jgi:nucleobase:cation symporter-1, NCS1 family
LPGLVDTIDTNIHVGIGTRLFDIAFLLEVSIHSPFSRDLRWYSIPRNALQFTLASTVYYTLSKLYPASDTMLDHAILEQDTLSDDRCHSGSDGKQDDIQIDETKVI